MSNSRYSLGQNLLTIQNRVEDVELWLVSATQLTSFDARVVKKMLNCIYELTGALAAVIDTSSTPSSGASDTPSRPSTMTGGPGGGSPPSPSQPPQQCPGVTDDGHTQTHHLPPSKQDEPPEDWAQDFDESMEYIEEPWW